MGIHIDTVRARAQVRDEHVRERIVSLNRPARPRGTRPQASIPAAQTKAQPVVDISSLDRIGWAFATATLIVWAIATALVQVAAP
jgi:hypothetical protein